jgi:hypothetical protein
MLLFRACSLRLIRATPLTSYAGLGLFHDIGRRSQLPQAGKTSLELIQGEGEKIVQQLDELAGKRSLGGEGTCRADA